MQQLLQPGVAKAAEQRLGLTQQVGDVLPDSGVLPLIRKPLRNLVDDGFSGGTRSMYCSPMAETLRTVAVTFDGGGATVQSHVRGNAIGI